MAWFGRKRSDRISSGGQSGGGRRGKGTRLVDGGRIVQENSSHMVTRTLNEGPGHRRQLGFRAPMIIHRYWIRRLGGIVADHVVLAEQQIALTEGVVGLSPHGCRDRVLPLY